MKHRQNIPVVVYTHSRSPLTFLSFRVSYPSVPAVYLYVGGKSIGSGERAHRKRRVKDGKQSI